MRKLLAATVFAALIGLAAGAQEQGAQADATGAAPAKASAGRKRGTSPSKTGAGRTNARKSDASKPGGTAAAKSGGAGAGQKQPEPCEPVKPCPID